MRHQLHRAFLGGVAALASIVGLLMLGPSTAAAPAVTFKSDLGYGIDLPAGWRPSTMLSLRVRETREIVGHDVLTARTPADEAAAVAAHEGLNAAWQGALVIEVWRNPQQLSALAWAGSVDHAGWAKGQVISSVRLAGRGAAVLTGGARHTLAYFVPRGSLMYVLGYRADLGAMPPGASEGILRSMVATLQLP